MIYFPWSIWHTHTQTHQHKKSITNISTPSLDDTCLILCLRLTCLVYRCMHQFPCFPAYLYRLFCVNYYSSIACTHPTQVTIDEADSRAPVVVSPCVPTSNYCRRRTSIEKWNILTRGVEYLKCHIDVGQILNFGENTLWNLPRTSSNLHRNDLQSTLGH